MQHIEALKPELEKPRKIAIIPHRRPDADALGSCLALYGYLIQVEHEVKVISPDEYPDFLKWMKGNESVLVYENGEKRKIEKFLDSADFIFCLDFSSLDRIEDLGKLVANSKAVKVLIDHHPGKENFAAYELYDTKASATAELIYDFLNIMGATDSLTVEMAECIYAGIMTDTGSFKYSSTSSKVHRTIADLIDVGVTPEKIHRLIYDTNSENKIKMLGFVLDQRLKVLREFNTAYMYISDDDLKRFQSKNGDTEGLVNYALSIEGIKLAALFIDRTDSVTMSFRSVGDFSVSEFASAHFNGGGHKNASGGKMTIPLAEVVDFFESLLPFYKDQLRQPDA
ncbi:DHH family phosphoesterase [Chondrinema litorale]|uniref:DHH family phosphoesterase n=1 Tax=Chondrinema litorale TaxID=2994555 RepID=UPI0025434688|nr:bifunctional oligoribonuclease/PAP phosphatase NrnA [Chondrinema litorale]UZR93250.1 bifunctional oligoribonuclease/PAP phosphatase NrnA [Chondrinema litorale]